MIYSKKIFLLFNVFVMQNIDLQAIDIKAALVSAMVLSTTDARRYHVRNASPDKIIVLEYTCPDHTNPASIITPYLAGSTTPSRAPKTETKFHVTLWPSDQITISKCDRIDSMQAKVQTGDFPFYYTDSSYYSASPMYNKLYTYRTLKVTTSDCKDHHWCHSFGYDKTSVFSRDYGVQPGEAEHLDADFSDVNHKQLMQEIEVVGNLRGTTLS